MIDSLLYVEIIRPNSYSFDKPFLKWFRNQYPKVAVFDIDNASDELLLGYSIEFLKHSHDFLLVVDARIPDTNALKLNRLYHDVIAQKEKVYTILLGREIVSNKMLSLLGQNFIQVNTLEEAQNQVITLFEKKQANVLL